MNSDIAREEPYFDGPFNVGVTRSSLYTAQKRRASTHVLASFLLTLDLGKRRELIYLRIVTSTSTNQCKSGDTKDFHFHSLHT